MHDRDHLTERLSTRTAGVLGLPQLRDLGWTRDEVRSRVRTGRWRRLLVGVFLVDEAQACSVDDWAGLPLLTRVHAGLAAHGADAVVVGRTAARLHGLEGLPSDDGVVHLRLPPGRERHQQPGVRMHTVRLGGDEVDRLGCLRVTSRERTLTDLVLELDRVQAVSALDAALHSGTVEPERLPVLRARARGRRGVARSAGWWDEADGRAESPLETRVRLAAVDAGYPPDDLQYPVRDRSGSVLGFADLAWALPGGRVLAGEADGSAVHSQPQALFRDRRRANAFAATGRVDMVRFTWADVGSAGYVAGVLRRHLGPPGRPRTADLEQMGPRPGVS